MKGTRRFPLPSIWLSEYNVQWLIAASPPMALWFGIRSQSHNSPQAPTLPRGAYQLASIHSSAVSEHVGHQQWHGESLLSDAFIVPFDTITYIGALVHIHTGSAQVVGCELEAVFTSVPQAPLVCSRP